MDWDTLRAELAKPDLSALNDAEAAVKLNSDPGPVRLRARFVDRSTILGAFSDPTEGVTVIRAIRAAAANNAALSETLPWIDTPGAYGIDVALPQVRATLDALAGAGVLTTQQAAAIKALGEEPWSRAESIGWPDVTATDVHSARA